MSKQFGAPAAALFLVGLSLAAPRLSYATTITLAAVSSGQAHTGYEGDGATFVDFYANPTNVVAGQGTGSVHIRSMLEFDISALAPGAVVTSATFAVTNTGESNFELNWNAFRQFGYAGDGTAVLDDAYFDGDVSLPNLIASHTSGEVYSTDVTAFIISLLTATEDFAGFIIAEPDSANAFAFLTLYSPGALTGAPSLTITFEEEALPPPPSEVPEPASLVLLGTGLAAVLARQRITYSPAPAEPQGAAGPTHK